MRTYHDMNTDIELLVNEMKIRQEMDDVAVAKLIGISAGALRNCRSKGTFPSMTFSKIALLAQAAGYDIKFERREAR